jgi:16S rRNA G966 N2-methylase RsmD
MAIKNYGVPYMGSKSKILHLIQYILERHFDKRYFIDLFCGGFSVSHYVLLHSEFVVLANDANKYVVALIEKALNGLPDIVYDFVDRTTFKQVIDNPDNYEDWYVGFVSTIYSFGNSQKTYMFGKDIEEHKKSLHNALVFNKWEGIATEFEMPEWVKNIDYKSHKEKRLEFMKFVKEKNAENRVRRLQQLERLQQLQQLQQLEMLTRLERLQHKDWRVFIKNVPQKVLENAIIYCDPPYENTAEYAENTFSHADFWQWFRETPYCVYVSSYEAPSDIAPVSFDLKNQLLAGGGLVKRLLKISIGTAKVIHI